MEKSEYNNQAIQEHHGDHVGTSGQGIAITMSADSREKWQAAGPCVPIDGQLSNLPLPYQPTIPNRRAGMLLPGRWHTLSFSTLVYLLALITSFCITPASAVLIDFNNCLSEAYQNGESGQPKQLQFIPLFMDARFNTTDARHTLQVVVWGNVTGSGPDNLVVNLPAWDDDTYWQSNATNLGGKIISIPDEDSASPKLTTLSNKVEVLTYEPYNHSDAFCDVLVNATCPLAPAFHANA